MADRKLFTNSVVPLPEHVGLTRSGLMVNAIDPATTNQTVEVMFSLGTPAAIRAELESKVAAGETVPASELTGRYGADPANAKALADWLASSGFTIKETAPDKTAIWAQAPASVVESVLQVKMVPVTRDGITYLSAANPPSLPSDIGAPVHAILGLQPFRRAQKHFRARFSRSAANRLALSASGKPSPNVANAPPYLVSEILKAYGGDGLGLSGKGQSIAILIDTFPADADLAAFWKANGLSIKPSQVTKITSAKLRCRHPRAKRRSTCAGPAASLPAPRFAFMPRARFSSQHWTRRSTGSLRIFPPIPAYGSCRSASASASSTWAVPTARSPPSICVFSSSRRPE